MDANKNPPEIYSSDHIEDRLALGAVVRVVDVAMLRSRLDENRPAGREPDFVCEYHYDHVNIAVSVKPVR